MSNWIAITTDTLKEAKVAALVEACDSAALGAGQDNRAAGIIQGVVNEVRAAVASCKTNTVDDDETKIPKGQRDLAVDLILARLKNTLEIDLTKDESDNVAHRRRQLREIAACELVVDQPDDPVEPEVQSGNATELLRQPGSNPFSGMGNT